MSVDNEAAFCALQGVRDGESRVASIAERGAMWGKEPIPDVEGHPELIGRQGGVEGRKGEGGEPCSCIQGPLVPALLFWRVQRLLQFLKGRFVASNSDLAGRGTARSHGLKVGSKLESWAGWGRGPTALPPWGWDDGFHYFGGDRLAGIVVFLCCVGRIGDGGAAKFDRQGSEPPVRGWAAEELRQKDGAEGRFNRSEGGSWAGAHALEKLPFHLERFGESCVGSLGEGATSRGKSGDRIGPRGNLVCQPGCLLGGLTNETSKEAAACCDLVWAKASVVAVNRVHIDLGGDNNGLFGLRVVAIGPAELLDIIREAMTHADGAGSGTIIGVPGDEEFGVTTAKLPNERHESYAVEEHAEGAALGDSDLAEDDDASAP